MSRATTARAGRDVTPKGMPELAYVGCVEISAHDADTIYVAATRYKLADYKPYLFKSTDGGRSWKSIKGDLPADEITRVVRADPVATGLLYVGTETGIHFSLDDGASWTRMAGGLPVVPVYDLKLKDSDLVAATHGRSFWILDDVTALRGLAPRKPAAASRRACSRRARRSAPSCTGAPAPTCAPASPTVRPSASTAAP